MIISKLKQTEIHKLLTLQPKGWPDIIPHFEFYTNSVFCLPLKLTINNVIVGIGTTIIHHNSTWLAHIIVHPDHRNKGIGKLITQELIKQAKEQGAETIQLTATELGTYVYEKLDFKIDSEYLFYRVPLNKKKHVASKFIVPYKTSFYQDMLIFDKNISGENREENIKQHFKTSFIFLKDNKIEGVFIPTLGEGLVIACTPNAGIELLKLRLNTHQNVIFPVNNITAKDYIESQDHKIASRAKKMWLGKKPTTKLANIYARIGGNLG